MARTGVRMGVNRAQAEACATLSGGAPVRVRKSTGGALRVTGSVKQAPEQYVLYNILTT